MNFAAAPWEALSAVYVAEDLNGQPIVYSLLKATTAAGAFLLGFVLAKVKVNRYGLLFVTAGIIEGFAFFITGMNTFLPLVFSLLLPLVPQSVLLMFLSTRLSRRLWIVRISRRFTPLYI